MVDFSIDDVKDLKKLDDEYFFFHDDQRKLLDQLRKITRDMKDNDFVMKSVFLSQVVEGSGMYDEIVRSQKPILETLSDIKYNDPKTIYDKILELSDILLEMIQKSYETMKFL